MACKTRFPDRYSLEAVNPNVPSNLTHLLQPLHALGVIRMKDVYAAAKTGYMACCRGPGGYNKEPVVCSNWVCGVCTWDKCNNPHLLANDLPPGYAKWLEDKIRPGVEALRKKRPPQDGGD